MTPTKTATPLASLTPTRTATPPAGSTPTMTTPPAASATATGTPVPAVNFTLQLYKPTIAGERGSSDFYGVGRVYDVATGAGISGITITIVVDDGDPATPTQTFTLTSGVAGRVQGCWTSAIPTAQRIATLVSVTTSGYATVANTNRPVAVQTGAATCP